MMSLYVLCYRGIIWVDIIYIIYVVLILNKLYNH